MKEIATNRVDFLRRLESRRPIVENFQLTWNQRSEDANFCDDYWFYLGVVQQMTTRFHEVSKEVKKINDKANSRLEQMEYEVKFLEEDTCWGFFFPTLLIGKLACKAYGRYQHLGDRA